jgi:photosystem II stability/assembly factor-like uncharacterized protein
MPNLTFSISNLRFADSQKGWIRFAPVNAIVDPPLQLLFQTTDGGLTWSPFSPPRYGWFHFSTARDGWSFSTTLGLARTHDGGLTWHSQSLPVPAAYQSQIVSVAPPTFFDGDSGVLPVLYYADTTSVAVLYVTADGGSTWRATAPLPDPNRHPAGQDQSITSSVSRDLWTVLFRGSLATSTDHGGHWSQFKPLGIEALAEVNSTGLNVAWGTGTFKSCAECPFTWGPVRSEDDGRTWSPLKYPGA